MERTVHTAFTALKDHNQLAGRALLSGTPVHKNLLGLLRLRSL